MRLVILCLGFSLIGCAGMRPKGDICLADAKAMHSVCYDMQMDFNDDGTIKEGHPPKYKPLLNTNDIHKHVHFDPDSWAEGKAFVRYLREKYDEMKAKCEK